MKQITERLKVCWYVLTMRNFLFFAYRSDKNLFATNDQGELCGVKDNSIHGFFHIDDVSFLGSIPTLRHLICENAKHILDKIKNNEL